MTQVNNGGTAEVKPSEKIGRGKKIEGAIAVKLLRPLTDP
jgi:hypothetical protein